MRSAKKHETFDLVTNAVVDFIIVAFVIFLLVRAVSRMRRLQAEPAPAAPATKDCTYCFSSIPVKATRCPHCTSELKAA